jgi:aminoglycoside 6-adenylyltransferase
MTNTQPIGEIIDKIVQWAAERESIRTVLLTSTRAIPNARIDALSDYDVILVAEDIHPFVADHTWLNDFGDVLVVYWDPIYPNPVYGIEQCANVTQYSSGLKIDFTLWPVTLFQKIVAASDLLPELDAGYQVLLDKDRLADSLGPPTGKAYIPKPPTQGAFHTSINNFLSDAPYVAKFLWRDELFPAKWCLDVMRHKHLRQMLEWWIEVEQGWYVPVGSLGKGLKKRLPTDIWVAVEQTYAGAQIADNWKALKHTLDLFRWAAVEVGDGLGYPYPEELHRRVCAYVEHIKQMEPPA